MRLLVTGGSGMVGRTLLGHPTAARYEILAPGRGELNLRSKTDVRRYIAASRPDIIVHAAGKVGGISANVADPYGFLVENVEVGVNIVSGAMDCGVTRFLNLASSCIYPRDIEGSLAEDLILSGRLEPTNEGYALAKIVALRMCEYASRQFNGYQYKTVIPCNLFGPFDKFDPKSAHLVPAVIRKVHEAKMGGLPTVEIWGDGSARREFMYSGDFAAFLFDAMGRFDSLPQLLNVGIGSDHSVLDYYRTVASVVGWSGSFTFDVEKPVGMRRKLLEVSNLGKWGWVAPTSLEDGIRMTYEYFLKEFAQ
jgi:GDP-L-fucose synthase